MTLKDSMHKMRTLLCGIGNDMEKMERGNKAASQRVRTASIHFAKIAKVFRKESVAAEKKTGGKRAKKGKSGSAKKKR